MRNNRTTTLSGALLLSLLLAACAGDQYGTLVCPPGPRDTLIVYSRLQIRQLEVQESYRCPDAMGSLYLGHDGGTHSEILVNFDIPGLVRQSGYPASAFAAANLRSVHLVLTRLERHRVNPDMNGGLAAPVAPDEIYFGVQQLLTPFQPARSDSGGCNLVIPDRGPLFINQDLDTALYGNAPQVTLDQNVAAAWFQAGRPIGLVIQALAPTDTGLVGFESQELGTWSRTAPHLVVEFVNGYSPAVLPASADASTFDRIAPLPADLLTVRTGLRSYPVVSFDLPPLPAGTCLVDMMVQGNTVSLSPLMANHCLWFSLVDTTGFDLDLGVISEEKLAAISTPGGVGCDLSAKNVAGTALDPFVKAAAGGLPRVLHLLYSLDNPDRRTLATELYYSVSTFSGPSASATERPALVLITGPKP